MVMLLLLLLGLSLTKAEVPNGIHAPSKTRTTPTVNSLTPMLKNEKEKKKHVRRLGGKLNF